MPRFFTHYWKSDTWDWQVSDGDLFNHVAGNLFRKREVGRLDFIYLVTVRAGQLHLGGRMQVDELITRDQAIERLNDANLWEAEDHAIAIPGTATPMRPDRIVPLEIVKQLRCVTGKGEEGLYFKTSTELDIQTLRGVRELTPESARILDQLIEPPVSPGENPNANAKGEGRFDFDVAFDPTNLEDERRRRQRDIVQRLGQSEFRQALVHAYDGRCAISGYGVEQTLQAAHIIPYLGAATNHVANGLLLRADLHNLFDSFLLSIDPETLTVCVALKIRDTPYGDLSGRKLHLPADETLRPDRRALNWHFEQFSGYEIGRNDFTAEELERARSDPRFHTTAEVLAHLHSL